MDYLHTDIRFFLPLSEGKTVWCEVPDENLCELLGEDNVRVQRGLLADAGDGEIDSFILSGKSSVSADLLYAKARPGARAYLSYAHYLSERRSKGSAEHYWVFPHYDAPRFMIASKDTAGFMFVADMVTADKGLAGKCVRILARLPFVYFLVQKIIGTNIVIWRL